MGPAVAEMEIDERPNEPFLFFAADKTDPGRLQPAAVPGLRRRDDLRRACILSPAISQGFRWVIMDVNHTAGDRVIELNTPEELYDLAALLRDPERFVVESVWSRASGEQAVAVATSRLHNIAGKYTGKDDPVMLVRTQMHFPATGEVLAPYAIGHFVAGGMRGSHNMPLMPVPLNSPTSYFDGPPLVSCAAFCVHNGTPDRSQRCLRPSVLGRGAGPRGAQGDRHAPSGLRRGGDAADVGAGVHGRHREAGPAGAALRGARRARRRGRVRR